MDIIVASSNLFRRELSSFILSEAGYTVHEVSTRKALVRSLDQLQPALILLDNDMNGNGEKDLVQDIRQRAGSVPLMLLTIGSVSFAAHTFDDYLKWPYQAEDLLVRVQKLLCRFTASSAPAVHQASASTA
jgi:DNA-binding response OmpR family regulator